MSDYIIYIDKGRQVATYNRREHWWANICDRCLNGAKFIFGRNPCIEIYVMGRLIAVRPLDSF